jgi:hypothetical protein
VSLELPQDDPWVSRGYGQGAIEPGECPAVLVVDLQYAFTDPQFPLGGAPLAEVTSADEVIAYLERAPAKVGG